MQQSFRQSFSGWEPKKLFTRNAEGLFDDVAYAEGFDSRSDGRSLVADDVDGDGDVDLVMLSRNGPRLQWFENVGATGNAFELELLQHRGHREADGAVVEVNGVGAFAVALGRGYASATAPRVHVGLGVQTAARVSVRWRNGTVEHFGQVGAGAVYRVEEGQGRAVRLREFRPRRAPPRSPWPAKLSDVVPEARGPAVVQLFMESCQPCRAEVPALNALHAGGTAVVGLGLHPEAELGGVARRMGMRYPIRPLPSSVAEAFEGPQGLSLPTVLVYGPDGALTQVVQGVAGSRDWKPEALRSVEP